MSDEKVKESEQRTIAEIKELDMQFKKRQELFAAAKDIIQIADLTKTETRTYSVYSQEKIRAYLKSPFANQDNLRSLSQFLYRMSHQYRRLIQFNAEMIDLNAYILIPPAQMVQEEDSEGALELFYKTANIMKIFDFQSEIYKLLLLNWREDAAYGYIYYDENEGLYIMPLDAKYCRISSCNIDGTYNFSYDMTFFRQHQELLEFWDKEFSQKYDKFQADNKLRWQELDPERTICLKINSEDPTLELPPFVALFEQICRLLDTAALQGVKDELSAYMLLVARLEHLQGSDTPDEFETDIQTAIAYFNKLSESLPECVNAVLSPVPIEAIQFKDKNGTEQEDMQARSMENLFATSGGYQILGSKQTNASILNAQIIADSMAALKPLLSQIEKCVNRFLTHAIGEHFKVKYLEVTPYTKKDVKEQMLKSGQYGIPVKLAIAALDGLSPIDALGSEFLENKCLKLHESWIPLQSSFTGQGGAATDGTDEVEGGAPKKDTTELSPEGEETRDNDKNNQ